MYSIGLCKPGISNITLLNSSFKKYFEKSGKEDLKTGMTMVQTEKKIAYYHQYFAVNKALESVKRASARPADDGSLSETRRRSRRTHRLDRTADRRGRPSTELADIRPARWGRFLESV